MMFRKYVAALSVVLAFSLIMAGCGGGAASSPTPPSTPPVITPPPAAPTASLSVNPATITQGGSAMLTWQTANATTVTIDALGTVQATGSESVAPAATTTYTLTAKGSGGTQTAMATVKVNAPAPPPPPPPPTTLAASYSFTLLPPLPGGSDSQALAINSSGIVAGYSTINGLPEATQWVNGQPIDLGPGYALAINDNGEMAGIVVGPGSMNEAAHWLKDSPVSITIGLLGGFDSIIATSIDSDGTLSGTAYNSFDIDQMEGYEWTAEGGIVAVPQLIECYAIRSGKLVGISPTFEATIAVQSSTVTSSTDVGVAGQATAINGQGDVVGTTSGNVGQAFFWSQGKLTLLGTGGELSSGLTSINGNDVAVGTLENPEGHVRVKTPHARVDSHPVGTAVGWSKTDGFVPLAGRVQDVPAGLGLANANSINDSGEIAGTVTKTSSDGTFSTTGFVLEPQ